MINDPVAMDCPPCKADDFELCNHTEAERQTFREARARKNREKKKRQQANFHRDRRMAYVKGDKWV